MGVARSQFARSRTQARFLMPIPFCIVSSDGDRSQIKNSQMLLDPRLLKEVGDLGVMFFLGMSTYQLPKIIERSENRR